MHDHRLLQRLRVPTCDRVSRVSTGHRTGSIVHGRVPPPWGENFAKAERTAFQDFYAGAATGSEAGKSWNHLSITGGV